MAAVRDRSKRAVGPTGEVVEPDHGVELLRGGSLNAMAVFPDRDEVEEVLNASDVHPRPKPDVGSLSHVPANRCEIERSKVEAHAAPRRVAARAASPRPARRIVSAALKIRWAECSGSGWLLPYQDWMYPRA